MKIASFVNMCLYLGCDTQCKTKQKNNCELPQKKNNPKMLKSHTRNDDGSLTIEIEPKHFNSQNELPILIVKYFL